MRIRLMTDYECHPLWEIVEGGARNVPVNDINISAELARQLQAWADQYDQTLNRDNPADSGFSSAAAKLAFETEGRRLWRALAEELGASVKVTYFSETEQRELE